MKPIGPNFRRFVSPSDPGSVVVPTPKRRRPPRDNPLEGTKAMNIPADKPAGDWMKNRTLHHFPHEALAHKLGIAAFAMVLVVFANLCLSFILDRKYYEEWMWGVNLLAIIIANICGIFSQVLSGGRCWYGAVALAAVWICFFVALLIGRG